MPWNWARTLDPLRRRIDAAAGGPARGRVVLTLAAVLAADGADKGTVAATATNLEHAFSVGTVQIGLLLTVTGLVGAVTTLPFGVLVDRVSRTRLLVAVLLAWAAAMLGGAVAPSYHWLIASRVLLGAMSAAGPPAVASLVGDWFHVAERGRILGLVLAGDLVGTGFGIAFSGATAAALSWRVAFGLLAVPAVLVAALVRGLPEPTRGGASRLERGQRTVPSERTDEPERQPSAARARERSSESEIGWVAAPVAEARVHAGTSTPAPDLARLPLWSAVRYVLGVRTNVVLIVSSALGYYLYAGVRAFGIEYTEDHYGLPQGLASAAVLVLGAGALAGVVLGGRLADHLLARGHLDARMVVPAVGFVAAAFLFAPAVITTSIVIALPLLVAAAFLLAAANPPLDAARLDVMPALLWGRAEGTRSVLRIGLEGLAPVVFGGVAAVLFGGAESGGLEATFVIMSVPLLASGLVLFLARRTYLGDAAAAGTTHTGPQP